MVRVRTFPRTFGSGSDLPPLANVRKNLSSGSSEVILSVTAIRPTLFLFARSVLGENWEEQRKKPKPCLANYIISHPIPEGWELRHATNDRVYFFNLKDSKPTATLWYDPLHAIAPESKLEPLPPKWKRYLKNGEIWYKRNSSKDSAFTQSLPKYQYPMTFEHVLKPVPHHFPHEFNVDLDEN